MQKQVSVSSGKSVGMYQSHTIHHTLTLSIIYADYFLTTAHAEGIYSFYSTAKFNNHNIRLVY